MLINFTCARVKYIKIFTNYLENLAHVYFTTDSRLWHFGGRIYVVIILVLTLNLEIIMIDFAWKFAQNLMNNQQ